MYGYACGNVCCTQVCMHVTVCPCIGMFAYMYFHKRVRVLSIGCISKCVYTCVHVGSGRARKGEKEN